MGKMRLDGKRRLDWWNVQENVTELILKEGQGSSRHITLQPSPHTRGQLNVSFSWVTTPSPCRVSRNETKIEAIERGRRRLSTDLNTKTNRARENIFKNAVYEQKPSSRYATRDSITKNDLNYSFQRHRFWDYIRPHSRRFS